MMLLKLISALVLTAHLMGAVADSGLGSGSSDLLPAEEDVEVVVQPADGGDCSKEATDIGAAAVIIISWNPPPALTTDTTGTGEAAVRYNGELSLASDEAKTECLSLNFTDIAPFSPLLGQLEIRADAADLSHPIYGCNYSFTLSLGSEALTKAIFTESPDVNLKYDCYSVYDTESHSYTLSLEWNLTISSYSNCPSNSLVDKFAVSLSHGSTGLRKSVVSSNNSTNGGYRLEYTRLNGLKDGVYDFQIYVIPGWIPFTCSVSAPIMPLPPTHPRVVDYTTSLNGSTQLLRVTWSPPPQANIIELYDYYLVTVSETPPTPYNVTLSDYIVPLNHLYLDIQLPITANHKTLFFQVQLFNSTCQPTESDSCSSPWSESVPLPQKTESCSIFSFKAAEPLTNEGEAVANARCYAACIDKYAPNALIPKQNEPWPSVAEEQLDCTSGNQVNLCYKGCVLRSQHSVQNYICTYNCVSQCKSECDDSLSCKTSQGCNRLCEFVPCSSGCGLWEQLNGETETTVLPSPVGLPIATPTMAIEGGEYRLALQHNNVINTRLVVDHVFVVKLRQQQPSEVQVSYIILPSLSVPLNLSNFNCEIVELSVAVVTSTGSFDDFTLPITLYIYGETLFPSHPDTSTIMMEIEEDFRPGFTRHSIMYLTWEKPTNYELIDFYQVSIRTNVFGCGSPITYTVDKNATSLTVQSAVPSDPPLFFCSYRLQIESFPSNPNDNPEPIFPFLRQVTREPSPTSINCSRHQDNETGVISVMVTFVYPLELPVLQATRSLRILPLFVKGRDPNPFVIGTLVRLPYDVHVNFTSSIYTEKITFLPVTRSRVAMYDTFRMEIQPFRNRQYSYRRLPKFDFCYTSARSNQPSTVEFVNVTTLELTQDRIRVDVELSPPAEPYSETVQYQVIISTSEVSYNESSTPPDSIGVVKEVTNLTINQINSFPTNISCFFVQARVITPFAVSDWNAPFVIGGEHCSIDHTDSPSESPSLSSVLPSPSVILITIPKEELQPTSDKSNPSDGEFPRQTGGPDQLREVQYHARVSLPIVAGAIAVVVIVVAVSVVIIALLILNHKKNKLLKSVVAEEIEADWRGGHKKHLPICGPTPDEWELSMKDITIRETLNEGVFGKVYQGQMTGPTKNKKIPSNIRNNSSIPVAIKMLKEGSSGKDKLDFLNEIEIMKKIVGTSSCSPHIVALIGCVTLQEPVTLVTSLVKHGDLHKYLQYIRKNLNRISAMRLDDGSNQEGEDQPYKSLGVVAPVDLLSFSYQIASGMEYISSLGIVHRDLATRNVLVEDEKTLKISDFGMSRVMEGEEPYVKTTRGRLPWKWMSIESLQRREFNSCSDVWSYGITLWEIATLGGFPYPSIPNTELQEYLESGARLEKPLNVSTEVYDVMLSCWETLPPKRPTFTDLRNTFSALISKSSGTTYIDLMADLDQAYYTMDEDLFTVLCNDQTSANVYDRIEEIKGYDQLKETAQYDHIRVLTEQNDHNK